MFARGKYLYTRISILADAERDGQVANSLYRIKIKSAGTPPEIKTMRVVELSSPAVPA